jgi:hypothetical protein
LILGWTDRLVGLKRRRAAPPLDQAYFSPERRELMHVKRAGLRRAGVDINSLLDLGQSVAAVSSLCS